jgi:hypothetical protein
MNKYIAFMMICLSSLICAQTINTASISQEELEIWMNNGPSDQIFEVPANTTFPVRFALHGDTLSFVQTKESCGEIVFHKTLYFQIVENDFLISSDLQKWSPFDEFFTGNLSVGFVIDKDSRYLSIDCEANERL